MKQRRQLAALIPLSRYADQHDSLWTRNSALNQQCPVFLLSAQRLSVKQRISALFPRRGIRLSAE